MLPSESVRWKGREATRLANGLVELIVLRNGGHLAEFRFLPNTAFPSQNVLWEAPWTSPDWEGNQLEELSQTAGFTGHSLCLDCFGPPSAVESRAGIPMHGEAAAGTWNVSGTVEGQSVVCRWETKLPVAQLGFERTIHLYDAEGVVYVEEIVDNRSDVSHACQWVQHATFAPPFLNSAESSFAVSAARGITSPLDYEGGSLLANDREFSWPDAPGRGTERTAIDLSRPFAANGRGFSAAVQLDPSRAVEFLLAINWKSRLGVGYCFRRSDFPWMAIWEENCARSGKPWNGNTQARGMEFGTTPLPVGREETFRRGDIFGTPSWRVIPAREKATAKYLIFLFKIPDRTGSIQNVEAVGDTIVLYGEPAHNVVLIASHKCEQFLAADNTGSKTASRHQ